MIIRPTILSILTCTDQAVSVNADDYPQQRKLMLVRLTPQTRLTPVSRLEFHPPRTALATPGRRSIMTPVLAFMIQPAIKPVASPAMIMAYKPLFTSPLYLSHSVISKRILR